MQTDTDLEALLLPAIQAAVQAGYAILDVYETEFEVEHKADQSPLTLADKKAHEIITAHLQPFGIPILSEEGRDIAYSERNAWPQLWIVDPLDGTKEFVKRNGEFTVNIALIEAHQPVMGVIYLPVKDTLYIGARGLGAYKLAALEDRQLDSMAFVLENARKMPLTGEGVFPAASSSRVYTIMGSRSHASPELTAFVEQKRREYEQVDFISAGSSLKICLVAEGKADIYPRLGPTMEWDTAAGQAIAENAGRQVLVWDTRKPMTYNREDLLNPWFVVT
jgi:3'(2'), 5'-bisphosphate nucleotidase